ncbi:Ig-like domain-containing protein, partial [Aestuariicoccus sp. MJ-SS9]|uniref:Ig-like domain-containing protein n=1 Tax=Aestuariicoccus sp. MJ-SS9 TaxID=3079855 RepID=UPI002912E011
MSHLKGSYVFSALRFGPKAGLNINGDSGNEFLTGSPESDLIQGRDGDDTIEGLAGDDSLYGNDDNDELRGGLGDDGIAGGLGDDTVIGGAGDDRLNGGAGNDWVYGGGRDDNIDAGIGDDTVEGSQGDDTIYGNHGNDELRGNHGNDELRGNDGNDELRGGLGDDSIAGGLGDDTVIGGAGDDSLKGGAGDDGLYGGVGNDDINAGIGDDTVEGGQGDDTIDGNNGFDTALYSGSILDYDFSINDELEVTITDTVGPEGTDELKNVEFLQFSDFLYEVGGNNAPLIFVGDLATDEDNAITFNLQAYDFDGDVLSIDLSVAGVGTLTLLESTALTPLVGSGVVYTLSFDPTGHYEALGTNTGGIPSALETLSLMVSDANGNTSAVSADVTITGVNDPPVAIDDAVTTDEDSAVVVNVQANDSDVDLGDTLTTVAVTDPANGSVAINGDGTVTYTPDPNYFGTDSFTYTIEDEAGATSSATVSLTVTPVNDPPVAIDDAVTTDEDSAVVVNVQANDSDVDLGDTLTTVAVTD